MAKIKVNLADLDNAINRSGIVSYSDNKEDHDVVLEISEGNDPSSGNMVDVLTIVLDKKEKTYGSAELMDVRHIAEIFPADRTDLDNRIITQKSLRIARAKACKSEDDIPF